MVFRYRFFRAVASIGICALLLGVMVSHRNAMMDAERLTRFDLMTDSYKISETVYEGTQLLFLLRAYRFNAGSLEEAQLQFDILWSRLDVLLAMDLELRPLMERAGKNFLGTLETYDPVIFSNLANDDPQIIAFKEEVHLRVIELRQAWINEFNESRFSPLHVRHKALADRQRHFEIAILCLLSAIIIYLLAELHLASVATRRERELRDTATEASRAKSSFIATVSHEIRTPLNGILGMAKILSESDMNAEQRECVRVLSESGGVLLSTINDVLDISKIEAGQIVVKPSEFSPTDIIKTACALYAEQARDKQLLLSVDIPEGGLPMLLGDSRRIRQVLHNLISNALKFTYEGSVTIRARYYERKELLFLSVNDTGPGIASKDQNRVFEPFSQTDDTLAREHGGTGLGLPISRDLCRAMGGDLLLLSSPGNGSQFNIRLPLPQVTEKKVPPAHLSDGPEETPSRISEKKVMVVDDNKTNRLILRKFLAPLGVVPEEASSGQQAVDMAKDGAFEIIFMDVQMPGMDGMDATRLIRDALLAQPDRQPQIIGVTANVLPDQIDSYLAAGMDMVLPKPVSKSSLVDVVLNGEDLALPQVAAE